MKRKLLGEKRLEILVFIVFAISLLIVSAFHEPWFDEAQAWEIAKGATLKELFFVIPHYEGHPPLWHLILAVPAKMGVPYPFGLKIIGIVISLTSAVILIFFSGLPRVAHLCLPFSYFFFYQYGIVTRPYNLMILILLLLGMCFSKRKEKPWRVTILLTLLCLCSAYGIVLSGGIAVCIVYEIIREKGIAKFIQYLFKDQRTLSLLALLCLAVILLFEIIPFRDTYYIAYDNRNSFMICLLCALFTFPLECFLTSASWFSIDRALLQIATINSLELFVFCIIGAIFWLLLICTASKKNLTFLLIPYILLSIFSAKVYFSSHHLGVVFMFFLFWAVFINREDDKFTIGAGLINKVVSKYSDYSLLKISYISLGIICLIIPIVWSITASIHDIQYDYYYSKGVADFIKEYDLDDCLIFGAWHENGSMVPLSEGSDHYVNTVMIGTAVPVNAYFNKNVFFNLNHNSDDKGFIFHRRPTLDEANSDMEEWRSYGSPDLIVGYPNLELVYGDTIGYDDYALVAVIKTKFIWKMGLTNGGITIFLRRDLLDRYHLQSLDEQFATISGLSITEEMRQRYYDGEPIEEILDPYLDKMFGDGQN